MKSSILFVAMLIMMSMTSCAVSDNDPMEQAEDNISMLSSYGARSLAINDNLCKKLHLDELPGLSAKEACSILSNIQKHAASEKSFDVKENLHGNFCDVDITMGETINHQYTFTIQLHMEKDNQSGIVYFKSFEADCSASNFIWYIKGFSFASDNETGNNKFESPSYLYFKVLDEEVSYIQVPVTVKGTYCPENNQAEFTYTL